MASTANVLGSVRLPFIVATIPHCEELVKRVVRTTYAAIRAQCLCLIGVLSEYPPSPDCRYATQLRPQGRLRAYRGLGVSGAARPLRRSDMQDTDLTGKVEAIVSKCDADKGGGLSPTNHCAGMR